VNQRDHIKALVEEHGADYHGDLTKAVTHLIAAAPAGKKYEHACRWGIKVVSLEWLDESIERGMVLDESLYDLNMNPAERGRGAWNRQIFDSITQGKRQRANDTPSEPVATNKRKIRRTMSAKLGSQQGSMWAEMASAGSAQARQGEWQLAEFDSMLGAIPVHLSTASADVTPDPTIEPTKTKLPLPEPTDDTQVRGVFRENLVYVHGFTGKKRDILRTHLESHGARICTSSAALFEEENLENGYLMIPHDLPEDDLPPIPELARKLQPVTEWWVECCLASKTLVNPVDDPLCRPFKKLAVEGNCESLRTSPIPIRSRAKHYGWALI
jgi:DNA replication regulator DPB11